MLKIVTLEPEHSRAAGGHRDVLSAAAELPDVQVRVLEPSDRPAAEVLDAVLSERPLADHLVVLGRSAASDVGQASFLCRVLRLRWDLAAVTFGTDDGGSDLDHLLAYGGAFRSGPVCQAGGFGGDGDPRVHDRLRGLGFTTKIRVPPAHLDAEPRRTAAA